MKKNHNVDVGKPAFCPVCKRYVEKGWYVEYKTREMDVLKLTDHKCGPFPNRMLTTGG